MALRGTEEAMGIKPWDVGAGGLLVREAGGGAIGRETALRESDKRYPVQADISKASPEFLGAGRINMVSATGI
jgi:fructose-1,6-bisphosphatase/inositol monophosphatase family enzyme